MKNTIKRILGKNPEKIEKPHVSYPRDLQPWEREIIEIAAPFTMTSMERMIYLIRSTEYVLQNDVPGHFAECGVWKGGSALVMALVLKKYKVTNRRIFLYDTFEGMTPPTDDDKTFDGIPAADKLRIENKETSWTWAFSAFDEVKENLAKTLDKTYYDLITFVKGDVVETLGNSEHIPLSISLLRLDTDWYESTKKELEVLFPVLSPNGILIIDDYGHWQGARKAVDEFFANALAKPYLHRIDYTGRALVKHGS